MIILNKKCRALLAMMLLIGSGGCANHDPKPYVREGALFLPGDRQMVWAVAPTLNLSGQNGVDPLLQSDIVFQESQQVHGLTVIPVNRVAEVYASLKIQKVDSEEQASAVCNLLSCDALLVPTITAIDPYNPPKLGAAFQLFMRPGTNGPMTRLDPHDLDRQATGGAEEVLMPRNMIQAVGMFDAADGSVRFRARAYATGRSDPNGPMGDSEIFLSMDRYCGFVYHELIAQLLGNLPTGAMTRP